MDIQSFSTAFAVVQSLGVWWTFALALIIIAIFSCVEYERGVLGLFFFTVVMLVCLYVAGVDMSGYIRTNPYSLLYIPVYFFIGGVWSVFKWYRLVTKSREVFDEEVKKFINVRIYYLESSSRRSNNNSEILLDESKIMESQLVELRQGGIPDSLLTDWKKSSNYEVAVPLVLNSKGRILMWIMLWPWSLLWYVIADLIKEISRMVFNLIKDVYEYVWRKVYSDVADKRLL